MNQLIDHYHRVRERATRSPRCSKAASFPPRHRICPCSPHRSRVSGSLFARASSELVRRFRYGSTGIGQPSEAAYLSTMQKEFAKQGSKAPEVRILVSFVVPPSFRGVANVSFLSALQVSRPCAGPTRAFRTSVSMRCSSRTRTSTLPDSLRLWRTRTSPRSRFT